MRKLEFLFIYLFLLEECAVVGSNDPECARAAAMDGPGTDWTDECPQFDFAKLASGREVFEQPMFTALQVSGMTRDL